MLVPIRMGTNMAAGNQQKHLSLSFATKAYIYLSRNSKNIKIVLFPIQETVQIAKFPEISHFLTNSAASRKCRVTQKLRNSSVVYRKTKNPFGTKIRLNISFQLLLYLIKVKYQQDQ